MFENLTDKITDVFSRLGNKGRLTEPDVDQALREIRLALLDADVHFRVARSLVTKIKEKVMVGDVLASLTAAQYVASVTNDELVSVLGGTTVSLKEGTYKPSTILMVGLNGSGKTTSSAKLAHYLSQAGQLCNLVAADVHRPAAIEQLETLGEQIEVDVYQNGRDHNAAKIAAEGLDRGRSLRTSWTIVDTAGRFQVNEELMAELEDIKNATMPQEVLLVVDAMTGQEAVNVAEVFHERIGLTGLVLTKMDGDARGGAALSITSVTGVPVKFIGTSERVDGLEQFHPDRLASRILGMGDVLTLVERAKATFEEDKIQQLEKKFLKATFD